VEKKSLKKRVAAKNTPAALAQDAHKNMLVSIKSPNLQG
jgi:hypothetical protein